MSAGSCIRFLHALDPAHKHFANRRSFYAEYILSAAESIRTRDDDAVSLSIMTFIRGGPCSKADEPLATPPPLSSVILRLGAHRQLNCCCDKTIALNVRAATNSCLYWQLFFFQYRMYFHRDSMCMCPSA